MSVQISHKLDLDPELPEKYKEVALKQGEDPNTFKMHLDELRKMIYERGDIKPHRTDDEYLLRFLRARFFKPENAYKLMTRYDEFRNANVELYKGVRPLELRAIGDLDIINVTPYRDHLGRRILMYRFANWKPSKLSLDDLFRATLIILEIGAFEPISQVMGGVGIFDFEGLTLNHCLQMTPSVAQKVISLMVTCMAMRTVSIHILNQNWVFDAVFQMFKPFLNQRMKEKIYFHGKDMKSFHKHIPPTHLPKKYDGEMPEFNYNCWLDGFKHNDKVKQELTELGYEIREEDELLINNNN